MYTNCLFDSNKDTKSPQEVPKKDSRPGIYSIFSEIHSISNTFTNADAEAGCLLNIRDQSGFTDIGSTFSNTVCTGPHIETIDSDLSFTGSTFYSLYTTTETIISIYQGSLSMSGILLQYFNATAITSAESDFVIISSTTIQHGEYSTHTRAVDILTAKESVSITESKFYNITGEGSPGVRIKDAYHIATLSTNNFTDCIAGATQNAGGLMLRDSQASIKYSTFRGNRATNGAAIYINCETPCYNNSIHNNSFENNVAELVGASVYFNDIKPDFQGNSYSGNEATYGATIGFYPTKVGLVQNTNSSRVL